MTDYIRNNKTLVFIILILLLSNIGLLFFFLKGGEKKGDNKPDDKMNPREYMMKLLKDSVGFTDEQVAKYDELSRKHKETIWPLFSEIKNTKDSLYKMLMVQAPADSAVNNLLQKIGEDQQHIDEKIFNHFRSLREICTPAQLPGFDSLTQHMIKRMIAGPSGRGGDRNRKK